MSIISFVNTSAIGYSFLYFKLIHFVLLVTFLIQYWPFDFTSFGKKYVQV